MIGQRGFVNERITNTLKQVMRCMAEQDLVSTLKRYKPINNKQSPNHLISTHDFEDKLSILFVL